MTVGVVDLPFLRIAEHAVRFGAFSEFCFGLGFVFRVAVGMPFERSLAVGRLDLIQGRGMRHTQHFVIIAWISFGHGNFSLSLSSLLLSMPDWDGPLHEPLPGAGRAHERRSRAERFEG